MNRHAHLFIITLRYAVRFSNNNVKWKLIRMDKVLQQNATTVTNEAIVSAHIRVRTLAELVSDDVSDSDDEV